MAYALEPALNNVDKALAELETAVGKRLDALLKATNAPQLNLTRDERAVNKRIAAKLDLTIQRLETLLSED